MQHVLQIFGIPTDAGRHVVEDRLFAQVVLDDLRNVRVNRLIIGDAGPGSIRERDSSFAINVHQTGNSERRIGAKRLGIEERVVDAPIDHIDAL